MGSITTSGLNSLQSLSATTASNNDTNVGKYRNRSVTIAEGSVVNLSEVGTSSHIVGKPLENRNVTVPKNLQ